MTQGMCTIGDHTQQSKGTKGYPRRPGALTTRLMYKHQPGVHQNCQINEHRHGPPHPRGQPKPLGHRIQSHETNGKCHQPGDNHTGDHHTNKETRIWVHSFWLLPCRSNAPTAKIIGDRLLDILLCRPVGVPNYPHCWGHRSFSFLFGLIGHRTISPDFLIVHCFLSSNWATVLLSASLARSKSSISTSNNFLFANSVRAPANVFATYANCRIAAAISFATSPLAVLLTLISAVTGENKHAILSV